MSDSWNPSREEVIEGLKKVWDAFDHMEHELYADYVFDALKMLKDQEPRVLTLEEVMQYIGYSEKIPPKEWEKLPLWTESRDGTGVFSGYRDILNLHNIINMGGIDGTYIAYKHWRCWSAKPTEEQREAVPWES